MKNTVFTMLVVLSLLILVMSGCESKEPAPEPEGGKKAPESAGGRQAPEFTLKSFDGKTINLSDYKGKIVVLEWFNYECPFVLRHYGRPSTMVKLANKYRDKNVVWLAINSTSHATVEENKQFAHQHNLSYPILDDRQGEVGRAYGAMMTPHMYIIDAKGNIAYQGAIDNDERGKKGQGVINYVDKALAELTSGKAVSTTDTKPYGCTVKYAK